MTRYYKGTDEKGDEEVFQWDDQQAPTLEETGYVKLEEVSEEEVSA